MNLHVAVGGWLLSQEPSGANRRLMAILRALPPLLAQGEQITVLHREGCLPPDPPAGVRWQVAPIPAGPTLARAWHERRQLPKVLKRIGANVYEQGFLPVASNLPCPVSLTIHDLRDLHGWRHRPSFLSRWVLRRSVKRCGHITVPSRFTERELRRAMGGLLPHVSIIPGCVDPSFARKEFHSAPQRPFLLHVGHLESRKNLMLLLSAYAQFIETTTLPPESRPDLLLVGADHGMLAELRERTALLELSGMVQFCGVVPEQELRELYADALAVVLPSLYEGFGLPALEGMAAGRPVLVSDRGALPEVAGTVGRVLPAEDASAWARAMEQLAKEPFDLLGDKRRAHATTFTWEHAAAQTLTDWRELLL